MVDREEPAEQLDVDGSLARAEVRVVAAEDPAAAAEELATAIDGELVTSLTGAEMAVAARMTTDDDHDRPRLDDEETAELRRLAAALGRAERIRSRTRTGVTESIARKVTGSTGVELHASALRDAATAVTSLEAELQDLNRELAELDRPVTPTPVAPLPGGVELPDMFDDAAVEAGRRRTIAIAIAAVFGGVALVLAFIGLPVPLAGAVAIAGIATAVLLVRSHDRQAAKHGAVIAETAERLAMLQVLDMSEDDRQRAVHRTELEASIARATERMRSAERAWKSIAGSDADPHDIDALLRARDPQYALAGATQTSPTIRAVDTLHRRAAARWKVAWAALGVDEAPPAAELEARLESLIEQDEQRPLVFVEPAAWVAADRMAELLHLLPRDVAVYIVKRASA
jgi:hypothetical protein